MADRYPILVERYNGKQGITIVCERCHAERVIDADELNNEDLYDCPVQCGGSACMKYAEADKCPSCGKLGFWHGTLGGCCSRVCMLQAEYAKALHDDG